MIDERQLKAENDEHYREAKARKAQPYVAKAHGDRGVLKMPHLGCYKPDGWEVSGKFFVDSSGWGAENEPALTLAQFLSRVKEGRGYCLASAGQFQVHVNEFIREGGAA
jgi:hypothetical protein